MRAAPLRPPTRAPQPLAQWVPGGPICGVLTDIDDTLTRDGAIEPAALQALEALAHAGLPVIAITGRPVGWSEPFARSWPLAGIVAENGAVCLSYQRGVLQKTYFQPEAERAAHWRRLQAVLARIEQEVPGAVRAADSAGRETDIAIDHSEHQQLGAAQIAQVVALMQAQGLHATVSSIHINGWIGSHDKWSGAQWAVSLLLGRRLADEAAHWVYVGDSSNDQPLFARLPHTVGVANIRHFLPTLTHPPRWITTAERGMGFAEVARHILAHAPQPQRG